MKRSPGVWVSPHGRPPELNHNGARSPGVQESQSHIMGTRSIS